MSTRTFPLLEVAGIPTDFGKAVLDFVAKKKPQLDLDAQPTVRPDFNRVVISDIDGVLADDQHRLHYIDGTDAKTCRHCERSTNDHRQRDGACPRPGYSRVYSSNQFFAPKFGKNWNGYFKHMVEDRPILPSISVLNSLALSNNVVLLTGRPEKYRAETLKWLNDSGVVFDVLLMRPDGNYKKNHELKEDLLREMAWDPSHDYLPEQVVAVFEDNPEAVAMYRRVLGARAQVYEIKSTWPTN